MLGRETCGFTREVSQALVALCLRVFHRTRALNLGLLFGLLVKILGLGCPVACTHLNSVISFYDLQALDLAVFGFSWKQHVRKFHGGGRGSPVPVAKRVKERGQKRRRSQLRQFQRKEERKGKEEKEETTTKAKQKEGAGYNKGGKGQSLAFLMEHPKLEQLQQQQQQKLLLQLPRTATSEEKG